MKPGAKRGLKIAGAVLLLLVLGVGLTFYSAFAGNSPIQDALEEGPVRVVKDGFVAVGVVDLGDGTVGLIDAGNDAAGKAILTELTRRGLAPDVVRAVLLTHGHPDHLAGAHLFPKATIYALEAELPLLDGTAPARSPISKMMGVKPSGLRVGHVLRDGETFALGTRSAQVFAIPGHTAGSAAYLIEGVVFLGDSAAAKSDGTIMAAPYLFSDDQAQNRASLKGLALRLEPTAAAVKLLVPAHSGAARGLGPLLAFAKSN